MTGSESFIFRKGFRQLLEGFYWKEYELFEEGIDDPAIVCGISFFQRCGKHGCFHVRRDMT